ncbi:MAG: hypothetical protein HUK25_07790, partial [Treponema sp.]|nr:hypothetical protein [Clostridia bacterium]MCF0242524.1 hypothetical protein [Treponema sp.]
MKKYLSVFMILFFAGGVLMAQAKSSDSFVLISGGTFTMGNSVPGKWDENDET